MPKKKPACPAAPPQAACPVDSPVAPCPYANPQTVKRGNTTITVDRVAKTITMTGTEEYDGPGASQAYADRASKEINDTWSGPTTFENEPYTVVSNIQGKYRQDTDPATPGVNHVHVVQTTVPAGNRNVDPAHETLYGGADSRFGTAPGYEHNTEDDDGGLTIAHEFGHTMGLPDEYTEGPRNPDGTRGPMIRTGPAGGLMGYIDKGSRPSPQNMSALVTGCGLAEP